MEICGRDGNSGERVGVNKDCWEKKESVEKKGTAIFLRRRIKQKLSDKAGVQKRTTR